MELIINTIVNLYLVNILNQDDTATMDYLWNKMQLTDAVIMYLNANGETDENINYVTWAIKYLKDRQSNDEDISVFARSFLGPLEGSDGDPDDDTYYPNTILPRKQLPTWQSYLAAYPKTATSNGYTGISALEVYELVGGSLEAKHKSGNKSYQNACAIRGSKALNYTGLIILEFVFDNKRKTEKGGDGLNCILAAEAFNTYTHVTIDDPTYTLSEIQIGNNLSNIMQFMVGNHVDFIKKGGTMNNPNINPKGGILKIVILAVTLKR